MKNAEPFGKNVPMKGKYLDYTKKYTVYSWKISQPQQPGVRRKRTKTNVLAPWTCVQTNGETAIYFGQFSYRGRIPFGLFVTQAQKNYISKAAIPSCCMTAKRENCPASPGKKLENLGFLCRKNLLLTKTGSIIMQSGNSSTQQGSGTKKFRKEVDR